MTVKGGMEWFVGLMLTGGGRRSERKTINHEAINVIRKVLNNVEVLTTGALTSRFTVNAPYQETLMETPSESNSFFFLFLKNKNKKSLRKIHL